MPVSAEALLLSALINTASVGEEARYGISAADFEGYATEYDWLTEYVTTYGSQPTADAVRLKFATFVLSPHTDIRSAADMVHRAANRRRLNTAMSDAVDLLHLDDVQGAYDTLAAAKPKRALSRPRCVLTDTGYLEEWDRHPYCVETPYGTLQRHTGGLRKGNLWYLAARPGMGKSAHACNFAKHAVMTGNRVLFNSLEMSEAEIRGRFHASLAVDLGVRGITLDALYQHRVDRAKYRDFIGQLAEKMTIWGGALDVHTPAEGPVSPSSIAARADSYDLIIVDYVGLMASDGGGRAIDDWRELARISNTLKTIALAQKVPILCVAQINREGETGSAPPKVKNLAQSDAWVRAAEL